MKRSVSGDNLTSLRIALPSERQFSTGFRFFWVIWLFSVFAALGLTIAMVTVAWHFISKYW